MKQNKPTSPPSVTKRPVRKFRLLAIAFCRERGIPYEEAIKEAEETVKKNKPASIKKAKEAQSLERKRLKKEIKGKIGRASCRERV